MKWILIFSFDANFASASFCASEFASRLKRHSRRFFSVGTVVVSEQLLGRRRRRRRLHDGVVGTSWSWLKHCGDFMKPLSYGSHLKRSSQALRKLLLPCCYFSICGFCCHGCCGCCWCYRNCCRWWYCWDSLTFATLSWLLRLGILWWLVELMWWYCSCFFDADACATECCNVD